MTDLWRQDGNDLLIMLVVNQQPTLPPEASSAQPWWAAFTRTLPRRQARRSYDLKVSLAGEDAVRALARTLSDAVGDPTKIRASQSFFDGLLRSSEQRLKHKPFLGDKLGAAERLKVWKVEGDVIVYLLSEAAPQAVKRGGRGPAPF